MDHPKVQFVKMRPGIGGSEDFNSSRFMFSVKLHIKVVSDI